MAQKLADFLTKLATDEELVLDYKKDAKVTMQKHGVPEEHIALVIAEKYDEIQKLLGNNYEIDINTNSIIGLFKK